MPSEDADLARLLAAARNGDATALGHAFERCRPYLLLIANEELDSDLRPKAGASDLVQDTLLEAQHALEGFQGTSQRQFLAWLRRILLNNLANFGRRYRRTERRQLDREIALDADPTLSRLLTSESSTPSGKAIRQEEIQALETALSQLPESYRRVIFMRHREHRSFKEIGQALERSTDAARMLWWRAIERLTDELNPES